MNLEQLILGVKDANGLDMSNEAAVTLVQRVIEKLVNLDVEPVAIVDEVAKRCNGEPIFNGLGNVSPGDKLYSEAQLISVAQRTAEACAKVCENLPHKFRSEFSNVSSECAEAIRKGKWRDN